MRRKTINLFSKKNVAISIHIILIVGSMLMILPLIWMTLTSLKSLDEAIRIPPTFFPQKMLWKNYSEALRTLPFIQLYVNTLGMVAIRLVTSTLFSAMAAYAFARIQFKGRDFFFILVLMQFMVPSQVFIIPQYTIAVKLGWTNTIMGLALPGLVSMYGTFLLRQFMLNLPYELEEAARIDGANRLYIFSRIILPLSRSGLTAVFIFTFLFAWKDLLWPYIVNTNVASMTISAGLASLNGQFFTNYPILMAGSMFAIVPVLILFAIFQRNFIQGISITGSKG